MFPNKVGGNPALDRHKMDLEKEVRMPAKSKGFTLYELLITTVLLALLAGIAIPSFADTLARQRQRAELDALFHAVHLARKESIMRRKVVSLCPSVNGRSCVSSRDWSTGWLMFENKDRDSPPAVDPGEPVLLTHSTQQRLRITANRKGFTFRATFLRATNGTIVVCDTENRIMPKALVISY
jgi:type IV fimbrial biogenesis protein FimT